MIYEHFLATGAYDAAQGLSDIFNLRLQNDDVQDFDTRWDQALLSASEVPTENGPGRFVYMSKLQDSGQLQTTLALYDQETMQNNGQPSYSRLKIAVGRQIHQQMRTCNFTARNEIVEKGAVTKRPEGRKAVVERKVGECYQWKALGRRSRGDSCTFSHAQASRNGRGQRQEEPTFSPAPKARAQSDEKFPSQKFRPQRGESFLN